MTKLLIPIVGSHFHPPAKQLLAGLPTGVVLQLQPEPDNPYDANAVLVHLRGRDIPRAAWGRLQVELDGTGTEMEDIMSDPSAPIVLGHCAATGGKPLAKLQGACSEKLSGTEAVLEFLAHEHSDNITAKLTFLPDGNPAVEVMA